MYQLSSNRTLFFKIFLPIFFTVFLGALSLAFLLTDMKSVSGFPINYVRPFFLGLFVFILFLMYRSWWQLHRLEADDDFLYLTNYFKTVKYSVDSIEKIVVKKGIFFTSGFLILKEKGVFGQVIKFKPNKIQLINIMENSPNWAGVVRIS